MPPEWHRQECVWVTRPHNPETWPGCLDSAQEQFDDFIKQLRQRVEVRDTRTLGIPSNDSWIRDYAPIFVINDDGELACHDFRFDSWGGKYPPWNLDDDAGMQIARHVGISPYQRQFVLEGGAIEVNGRGTLLTTNLHRRRNPQHAPTMIQRILRDALGTPNVVQLSAATSGDDTDGHVDNLARFVGTHTIVAVRAPRGQPDHEALEQNWQALARARDQDNQQFELVELPAPTPIRHPFPADHAYDVARCQLPASYANFLVSNGAIFVPTFSQPTDDLALAAVQRAAPQFTIVPVPCEWLLIGLGAIHCLTMQQPTAAGNDGA